MIHRIQTTPNTYVNLEVKPYKSEPSLIISKNDATVIFNQTETKQLNTIVQAIDPTKYTLKEYGSLKKGTDLFKISISEFRGIKSFQIRQWLQSPTYSGYGKLGISLPTYKLKELQTHLITILQEFQN
jgi:hypothetical protein